MNHLFKLCSIGVLSALMGGCAATDILANASAASAEQLPDAPPEWTGQVESVPFDANWVETFDDATLTRLVEEAFANNRNLQANAAGVDRAWALAEQSAAAGRPTLGLTTGAQGSDSLGGGSPGSNQLSIGARASWDLDLWGRIRAGRVAAEQSAAAVEADARFARYSIAAGLSKAYFGAIETGQQKALLEQTVANLERIAEISRYQHESGLAGAQDVALIESDLATTRERLTATQTGYDQSLRALEVLIGRYPSAALDLPADLPTAPVMPPAGVPSDILARRPDLIAAERRVAAAFNATEQARVANLPSLSLTGSLGGASSALSSILNPSNVAWSIGASLFAPLFDGGANEAQIAAATAEQEQALALYGQAALEAFQDVENNLAEGLSLDRRQADLRIALDRSSTAYGIAQLRYDAGESSLVDTLDFQQRVLTAESNLTQLNRSVLDQRINLFLALGGEWESGEGSIN